MLKVLLLIKIKHRRRSEWTNQVYHIVHGKANTISFSYPGDILTTINIDLESGKRIKMKDVVKINDEFVEKLRETLNTYIIENPDWEPVYTDKLRLDNDDY